jgi:uncharacterized iron-regulated membrane protein
MLRRRFRGILRLTHLVLGLSVLLPAAALAISGLLLLFEADLAKSRLPALPPGSAARPPFLHAADLATIDRLAGPAGWDVVRLPGTNRPWFDVWLASGERAYLVPGASAFVDRFRPRQRIETLAFSIHTELLAGASGAGAVAWSGVTVLILVVSGYGLWLTAGCPPVLRHLRRPPRRRTAWLAAHGSLGVAAGLPLIAGVLTGAAVAFPDTTRQLLEVPEQEFPVPAGSLRAAVLDWRGIVASADATFPDDIPTYVFAPRPGTQGVIRVRTRRPGEWDPAGLSHILVDPASATVVGERDGRPAGTRGRVQAALYPVHSAQGTARPSLPLAIAGGLALLGGAILAAGAFALRLRR